MIRRIVRAIIFGAAATMAVMTIAPVTKSPEYALTQVWWALGVGALVALGVGLSS